MNIEIKKLESTEENILLVASLMEKDTSGKCFTNKDFEGNIVSYIEMAKIFLNYAQMYRITAENVEIGLIMISNGNEIGVFIEPDFQNMGIATKAIELLKGKNNLKELVTEATLDNEQAIKSLQKNGFIETGEKRTVTINGKRVLVKKYINLNFN